MHEITPDSLATISWNLRWQSDEARHEERFLARRVNFWRDIFPKGMSEALMGAKQGDVVGLDYAPGQALPRRSERRVLELERRQLRRISVAGRSIPLLEGRFYPRRLILGEAGILPEDFRPFRLLQLEEKRATADLNHPLAGRGCRLEAEIINAQPKRSDTGGQCYDWVEAVVDWGPGMQARSNGAPTVFQPEYPLPRADEAPDTAFYSQPRMVNHVDAQAREHLATACAGFLQPGMRVLDLMSSVQSHLPAELPEGVRVAGLGLNMQELEANPRLDERHVQDLNAQPGLPFEDGGFDLVLCSLSVEYLTDPLAVFAEVRRVLAPGGRFVLSFSDRWFPTKVAGAWPDLHPFERMGQVLHWLLETGGYEDLHTVSIRNWWRPFDDAYYGQLHASDPVFIVDARRAAS